MYCSIYNVLVGCPLEWLSVWRFTTQDSGLCITQIWKIFSNLYQLPANQPSRQSPEGHDPGAIRRPLPLFSVLKGVGQSVRTTDETPLQKKGTRRKTCKG